MSSLSHVIGLVNSLLVGIIVIILTSWVATVWQLTQATQRRQRAWQWWQQHQLQRLHIHAESIRDGLLQQTFAFRRYFESDTMPEAKGGQSDRWLERFNQFYQSLETLSNELSPPFVDDSLPLALQFILKDLESTHPRVSVTLELPQDWTAQSSDQNPVIISIVVALLDLLPSDHVAGQLTASLVSEAGTNALDLRLEGLDQKTIKTIHKSTETKHIKEIFNSLLVGKLEILQNGETVLWQLQWAD